MPARSLGGGARREPAGRTRWFGWKAKKPLTGCSGFWEAWRSRTRNAGCCGWFIWRRTRRLKRGAGGYDENDDGGWSGGGANTGAGKHEVWAGGAGDAGVRGTACGHAEFVFGEGYFSLHGAASYGADQSGWLAGRAGLAEGGKVAAVCGHGDGRTGVFRNAGGGAVGRSEPLYCVLGGRAVRGGEDDREQFFDLQ